MKTQVLNTLLNKVLSNSLILRTGLIGLFVGISIAAVSQVENISATPFDEVRATITNERYKVITIGASAIEQASGVCLPAETSNNNAVSPQKVKIGADNASSATVLQSQLGVGCNAQVKRAFLYWGGSRKGYTLANYKNDAATDYWMQDIRIKKPGGAFQNVRAQYWGVPSNGQDGSTNNRMPYYCVAEVTTELLNSGAGVFTVADIDFNNVSGEGGVIGAWTLILMYESSEYPLMDFYLWDGIYWKNGDSDPSDLVKTTAISAPATGDISSFVGVAAMDADVSDGTSRAEVVKFQSNNGGVLQNLNTLRGVTDFLSSSMTYDGAQFTKYPDCINTFGYDAHHFTLPDGAVTNSATTATLTITPSGDQYICPFMLYLGIIKNQPHLRVTKVASSPSVVFGQTYQYMVIAENIGGRATSAAEKIVMNDTIDHNLIFSGLVGDISVKVNGVAQTYNTQANITWDPITRALELRALPAVPKDGNMVITYKVTVAPASSTEIWRMSCMQDVYNKAKISYYDDGATPHKLFQTFSGQDGCNDGNYTVVPVIEDFTQFDKAADVVKVVAPSEVTATFNLKTYLQTALSSHLGNTNGISDFTITKLGVAVGATTINSGNIGTYTNANGVYVATRTVPTHPGKPSVCTETYNVQLLYCSSNTLAFSPATVAKEDIVCVNAENGQILPSVSGNQGTTMFYTLANGSLSSITDLNSTNIVQSSGEKVGVNRTNHNFSKLPDGTYTVFAVDGFGCERHQTVTLTDPSAIVPHLSATAACIGDPVTFTAAPTGGVSGTDYGYTWYRSSDNGVTFSEVESQNIANKYTVTSQQNSVTMKVVAHSLIAECSDVYCASEELKTVTLSQTPDLSCSSVSICPGSFTTLSPLDANNQTASRVWKQSVDSVVWVEISGETAATLTVSPTDTMYYRAIFAATGGCADSVDVKVSVPDSVNATVTPIQPLCFGQTGALKVTGLSGGANTTYSYQLNATGAWTSIANGDSIKSLTDATHSVVFKDANACLSSAKTGTITVPTQVVASSVSANPNCYGGTGTFTMTVSGGTPTYEYSMDSLVWSPLTNGQVLTSIADGAYIIRVQDANKCPIAVTLKDTIVVPAEVTDSIHLVNPVCNGATGKAKIYIYGGSGTYQYSLNGGAWANIASLDTIYSIPVGAYTISVRDSKSCLATDITGTVVEPAVVTATVTPIQPLCFGQTGALKVTGLSGGANTTYSYQLNATGAWTSIANGDSIKSLTDATHSIVFKDANACLSSAKTGTITVPTQVVASSVSANPNCYGGIGTFTMTVSGGTPTYEYSMDSLVWSPLTNGQVLTSIADGAYKIRVQDANKCPIAVTLKDTIVVPDSIYAVVTKTDVSAFGLADGAITLSGVVGGNGAAREYRIEGVETVSTLAVNISYPASLSGLKAGKYTVYARNVGQICEWRLGSVTIIEPGNIIGQVDSTHVLCYGGTSATITVKNVTGGLAASGYDYLLEKWNGTAYVPYISYSGSYSLGTVNKLFTGVSAGTYQVKAKDQLTPTPNESTIASDIVISQPTKLVVSVDSINPLCSTGKGRIAMHIAGGTGSYKYSLNAGALVSVLDGDTLNNLNAGAYSVLVQDSLLCDSTINTHIVIPTALTVSLDSVNPTCSTGFGKIVVHVSGGTGAYRYEMNASGSLVPVADGDTIQNLTTGSYSIVVRDANDCLHTALVRNIKVPSAVIASGVQVDPKCYGGTGKIGINVSGGTGGTYTYQLDGAATWVDVIDADTITGLSAATHTVLVRDSNLCEAGLITKITAIPSQPVFAITPTSPNCYNQTGSIEFTTLSGGTLGAGYKYSTDSVSWTGLVLNDSIKNLVKGTYVVRVLDGNNCPAVNQTTSITVPDSIFAVLSKVDISIVGNKDGAVTYTSLTGGLPAGTIEFKLVGTETISGTAVSKGYGDSTTVLTSLAGGSYTVYARNVGQNCEFNLGTVSISEPGTIKGEVSKDSIKCNGLSTGTIKLTKVEGGNPTGGYAYQLERKVVGVYTVYQAYGAIKADTFETFENLPAGTYQVKVKDDNTPTVNESTIATEVVVYEPTKLVVSVDSINPLCSTGKGRIAMHIAGGTGSYKYSLNAGALVSVLDGDTLNNLNAGAYSILVQDSLLCDTTINTHIVIPAALTVSLDSVNPTCSTGFGKIVVHVSGGTGAYRYEMNASGSLVPVADGDTIQNLTTGSYSIVVRDANDCLHTALVRNIKVPSAVIASGVQVDPKCYGGTGKIGINVSGGTGGTYTYQLDGAATWVNVIDKDTITGLSAATHTVLVRDSNLCEAGLITKETAIPTALSASATAVAAICSTGKSAIVLTVAGGTPDVANKYLYKLGTAAWTSFATGDSVKNLAAGSYTFDVKDANDCAVTTTEATVLISAPVSLVKTSALGTDNQLLCVSNTTITDVVYTYGGAATGATVTLSDGVSPLPTGLSYSVNTTAKTVTITGTIAGIGTNPPTAAVYDYIVKTTGANSPCSDSTLTGKIEVVALPSIVNVIPDTICGSGNANLSATAVGTINWYAAKAGGVSLATGASFTTPIISATTQYYMDVTVGNCVSLRDSVLATIINKPTVPAITAPTALCVGGSLSPTAPTVVANGSTVTAEGWEMETAVSSGTYAAITLPYTVVLADSAKKIRYYATNTCGTSTSNAVAITVHALPTAELVGKDSVCKNTLSTVNVKLTGTSPWIFTVSDGTNSQVKTSTLATYAINETLAAAKTYTITSLQDANCSSSVTGLGTPFPVTVAPVPDIVLVSGSFLQDLCAGSEMQPIVFDLVGGVTDVVPTRAWPSSLKSEIVDSSYILSGSVLQTDTLYFQAKGQCGKGNMRIVSLNSLPLPDVALAVSPSQANGVCLGADLQFNTTLATHIPNEKVMYTWTTVDGTITNTSSTYKVSPTTVPGSVPVNVYATRYDSLATPIVQCVGAVAAATGKVYDLPSKPRVAKYEACALPTGSGTVKWNDLVKINNGTAKWYVHGTNQIFNPRNIDKSVAIDTLADVKSSLTLNNYTCESKEAATVKIRVFENPRITRVIKSDLTNIQLEVINGTLPYRYSVAGKSGSFDDVADMGIIPFGTQTVTVTDSNLCVSTVDFTLDPVPLVPEQYFTPNGDGLNDTWGVKNLEFYPNSEVYVHDRYGKELFKSTGDKFKGWDGIYEGNEMPGTDYWYIIYIHETGKRMFGHFLLKR